MLVLIASSAMAQSEKSKAKLIDPANMDVTIKPGDDFQKYAGGVWLKNNPVPAKESTWGSFTILRDFNVKAVREILKDAMADKQAAVGTVKRRVGDFYAAAMDSLAVENAGFSPVKEDYLNFPECIRPACLLVSESLFRHAVTIHGTDSAGRYTLAFDRVNLLLLQFHGIRQDSSA